MKNSLIFNVALCFVLTTFSTIALAQKKSGFGNNSGHAKSIFTRGVNFYIEEYGKGEPIILLHGNGGDISAFTTIIPILKKQFRVIAMDSRAHGKSADKNDSLSFEMMADDVSAIVDSLHLGKVYIVGWSDGGIVGIEFAMRHPEQLKKMAVTGANLWPDSTALEPKVWLEAEQYFFQNKDKKWVTEKERNDWKIFLLDWYQPNITLKEIAAITTPSLIIAGDHDLIRLSHTKQIFSNIPNAGLWIVPFSGHGTLIEHPAEFCQEIIRFFMKH